jgi:hypothetical protein
MYFKGDVVTIEWLIPRTTRTLVAADFDVYVHHPVQSPYIEAALTFFSAPTEATDGLASYDLTLDSGGVYQVELSSGTADDSLVCDIQTFFVQSDLRYAGRPGADPYDALTSFRRTYEMGPARAAPEQGVVSPDVMMALPKDVATDGNGNWVIVGSKGIEVPVASIMYSANGKDWTEAVLPDFTITPQLVGTDGAGTWLAFAGGPVLRSVDNGATWAVVGSIPNVSPFGVHHLKWLPSANAFVHVQYASAYYSTDLGATWTIASGINNGGGAHKAMAISDTHAILYSDNGVAFYASDNAGLWQGVSGEPIVTTRAGDYANGLYVFGNNNGDSVITSSGNGSGMTVHDIDPASIDAVFHLFWNHVDAEWIASTHLHNDIWYRSPDAINWTKIVEGDWFGFPHSERSASSPYGYVVICNLDNLGRKPVLYKRANI